MLKCILLAIALLPVLSVAALEDPTQPKLTTEIPTNPHAPELLKTTTSAETQEPTWTVQYILNAPHRHLVSINHELLSEGDSIQGWQLQTISANSVTLTRSGHQLHVRLFKNTTLPTPIKTSDNSRE